MEPFVLSYEKLEDWRARLDFMCQNKKHLDARICELQRKINAMDYLLQVLPEDRISKMTDTTEQNQHVSTPT